MLKKFSSFREDVQINSVQLGNFSTRLLKIPLELITTKKQLFHFSCAPNRGVVQIRVLEGKYHEV